MVGHQPLLPPGESFEYTSWATIKTPVGTMRGEYFCVAEDGHRFEAPIPEFALVMPRIVPTGVLMVAQLVYSKDSPGGSSG